MKFSESVLWKGVDELVLKYFRENPDRYHKVSEIKVHLLDNEPMLHMFEIMGRLAYSNGIYGKIRQGIQKWQMEGFPIISSADKGKGYIYMEFDNEKSPGLWDSKFRANQTRTDIAIGEINNDNKLLLKYLSRCKKSKLRMKLKAIAVKYKVKEKTQ